MFEEQLEELLRRVLTEHKIDVTLVDRYGRVIVTLGVPLGINLRRNAIIKEPGGSYYKVLSSPLIDYTDRSSATYPSVKVVVKQVQTEEESKWLSIPSSAGTE